MIQNKQKGQNRIKSINSIQQKCEQKCGQKCEKNSIKNATMNRQRMQGSLQYSPKLISVTSCNPLSPKSYQHAYSPHCCPHISCGAAWNTMF